MYVGHFVPEKQQLGKAAALAELAASQAEPWEQTVPEESRKPAPVH